MFYALDDLLGKMGAPEVKARGRMGWHYFDGKDGALAGFADIRLGAGGAHLIAELKHIKENYEDDTGAFHPTYTESFYLYAERLPREGYYKIAKIAFDGEEYAHPQKGIVELGLSLFHARALDISIRMIEQTFNKEDILTQKEDAPLSLPPLRSPLVFKKEMAQDVFGVVVPFRPRHDGARV